MNLKTVTLLATLFLIIVMAAIGLGASLEADQDNWHYSAAIYLWGASIGGNTESGNEIEVEFEDILDKLSMAFMGTFGASKGKWTVLADVIYQNAENDKTAETGLELSAEVTSWLVTPGVAYNLADTERFRFDTSTLKQTSGWVPGAPTNPAPIGMA